MHARVIPAVAPPLRWVMWAIPVFLFLIGFFHRAAPGVIARDLMRALDATRATIGLLAATYFYSCSAWAWPAAPSCRWGRSGERSTRPTWMASRWLS